MYEDFFCTAAPAAYKPAVPVAKETWPEQDLTLVLVVREQLRALQRLLPVIMSFVDRVVVVDGFSKDGTGAYLETWGPKVQIYQADFGSGQQLNEAFAQLHGGWVLLLSEELLPSQALLENLRGLVAASEEGNKYGAVEFLVNLIHVPDGKWSQRVDNGPLGQRLPALFKWYPELRCDDGALLAGTRGSVAGCDHLLYMIR